VLHRAAYRELGLDWSYEAIECRPEALGRLMADAARTWAGLSLTMPLKRVVLPMLDRVAPMARAIGCANTVTVENGRLIGDNTDVHGMLEALAEAGVTRPSAVTVLGAGATAATALAAVKALDCGEVTVVARDPSRAVPLLEASARLGVRVALSLWSDVVPCLETDLVVSALPPGATDRLALEPFRVPAALFDVVYKPWPTPFAAAAAAQGSVVIGGLSMLLHQAARQVVLQTGCSVAPLQAMRAAAEEHLRSKLMITQSSITTSSIADIAPR
jgi:shikimate dehydrogenase